MADWILEQKDLWLGAYPIGGFITAAEGQESIDASLKERIGRILELIVGIAQHDKAYRKYQSRLQAILGTAPKLPLQLNDIWSVAAAKTIATFSAQKQAAWAALLHHVSQTSGGTPSPGWKKETAALTKVIGASPFRKALLEWFPLVDKPRPSDWQLENRYNPGPDWIHDTNAEILKGLTWASEPFADDELLRAIGALAYSTYRRAKVHGHLAKIGNACVYVLGAVGTEVAVTQLVILRAKVKYGTAQAMIEKALEVAACRASISREDIEELGIPSFGLTSVGFGIRRFGEITAEVHALGAGRVEVRWRNATGQPLKSPPAPVKKDHASELKELKQLGLELGKLLAALSQRLDQMMILDRSWPLSKWRDRYLDHLTSGVISRQLIWQFSEPGSATSAIWRDGQLEDVSGRPFDPAPDASVSLWHPLDANPSQIRAWRERLEALQFRQPFKQAHREIYTLTPAEEVTGTYSNRFAAHVLRQNQFHALCAERGWKDRLRLIFDGGFEPANQVISHAKLRAEFWVQGAGDGANHVGAYTHVTTDQVRFYPHLETLRRPSHYRPPQEPLSLAEIPRKIFSEIMRDIDLFVGVSSVGNDPTWSDGGPENRYRTYWESYAFGKLSGSAQTRKDILERLIPKLKIASKCAFEERFLVVNGTLHDYKIHLGSGNILMSPDDRYLCIVAHQTTDEHPMVFLPFEGDGLLAIILSKAVMLADDLRITDPTILRQIKG